MKIIRHIAPDMRQAMPAIRAQLGEDAVILSSRRIAEGVELTAAVDFDAASLQSAMAVPAYEPTHSTVPGADIRAPGSKVASLEPTPGQPAMAKATTASPHVVASHAAAQHASALFPPTAAASTAPSVYSHAASSHYFPAPAPAPVAAAAADARPFAHILRDEPVVGALPVLAPTASIPTSSATPIAPALAPTAEATPARREPTLNHPVVNDQGINPPSSKKDFAAEALADLPPTLPVSNAGDAMGSELKTLRRMLETQLAQLAWNDLTRRAPVHVEILRELTEIGITPDLSDYILKQLPEKVEIGFARRFAIAGLSQYLTVSSDRWLESGGRVAFIGATGVGKTTTIAKLAVRWVLRHGPRDMALVGCDTVRIGAQDQIQSLGQLLGVPVYTPENFESLPTLLSRLGDRHRFILIDTPGSSLRDAQLASRLGVLSNCASQMETALVLAGSTQAGAIEETIKRFAPANPACCVLTKLDEAASLGGALSALIRARLPVSYVSEGQRVPEDLRPARALELVSTAVRLAKASGAAADEDLLRRRFGKTANAIT